jgi:hypothetical protein
MKGSFIILISFFWLQSLFGQKGKDVPVGTIRIGDYFIDQFEIAIIHWLEYEYYNKQKGDSILPDSSVLWYRNADFRYKPIVGITYEQALDFCEWRSKMVSEIMKKNVRYTLPTEEEWTAIAKTILKNNGRQISKQFKTIYSMKRGEGVRYELSDIRDDRVVPAHFFDNVSEMCLEKGIAMGINNFDIDSELPQIRRYNYDSPNLYLGFRCIASFE